MDGIPPPLNRVLGRTAEPESEHGTDQDMKQWPPWWVWELELSPHLLKRMEDRRFTEVDLRRMLEQATGYRPDVVTGRWAVSARHRRRVWEVIVEPLPAEELLLVITAYPVDASRT